MREPVYFFTFQKKTAFMPLKYLYQTCSVLIDGHTQVEPLQCFRTSCPATANCAEILAKRVHYLFEEVFSSGVEQLFVYFRLRNAGFHSLGEYVASLGGVQFHRDMREPRWMKLNRWGFNKLKKDSVVMSWIPTDEFLFMGGSKDILIPQTDLLKKLED